jgi:hypothetical protein
MAVTVAMTSKDHKIRVRFMGLFSFSKAYSRRMMLHLDHAAASKAARIAPCTALRAANPCAEHVANGCLLRSTLLV